MAIGCKGPEASGRDDTERKDTNMAANLDQIVEQLSGLTVIEAADLSKKLEEKWGVSAAAPVAMAAAPGGGAAGGAPAAEVKTTFDVVLKETGPNKITVIKEVPSRLNTQVIGTGTGCVTSSASLARSTPRHSRNNGSSGNQKFAAASCSGLHMVIT